MQIKKIVYLTFGLVSLVLGLLGTLLPFIPTVPFLLLSAYCFGRSSEKLNNWFKNTKIYKNNLESYVKKEGMTILTKTKIIFSVTLLMGFGFYMMGNVLIGRIVLGIVWFIHIIYFLFIVKTIKK